MGFVFLNFFSNSGLGLQALTGIQSLRHRDVITNSKAAKLEFGPEPNHAF